MGVKTAHLSAGARPGAWSLATLVLAGIGVVISTWLILGSDGDSSHVVWPLAVAPLAVCLVPTFVPRRGARITAAAAIAGWCILTGFSIGFLLLPALLALLGAVLWEAA